MAAVFFSQANTKATAPKIVFDSEQKLHITISNGRCSLATRSISCNQERQITIIVNDE